MTASEDPSLSGYVVSEFFDHVGVPLDSLWLTGRMGMEVLARVRDNLSRIVHRIQSEWFSAQEEGTAGGEHEPWWTQAECAIIPELRDAAWEAGMPFVRKAPWPSGQPFAAVVSHDVDVLFPAPDFATNKLLAQIRYRLPGGRNASVRSMLRVAHLDQRLGVPASFYPFDRYPRIQDRALSRALRVLLSSGFEVGLHASSPCKEDGARMSAERRHLQELGGATIYGTRLHGLAFNPRTTWRCEADAGFDYDTSFGWNQTSGFRSGSGLPFHAYDPGQGRVLPLLELPMAYMDWTDLHRGGDRDQIVAAVKSLIEQTKSVSGLLVVNFHNSYLRRWTHREPYRAYIEVVKSIQTAGAWLATGNQCASWWRHRCGAPVDSSTRDRTFAVRNPEGLPLLLWPDGHASPHVRTESTIEMRIDSR